MLFSTSAIASGHQSCLLLVESSLQVPVREAVRSMLGAVVEILVTLLLGVLLFIFMFVLEGLARPRGRRVLQLGHYFQCGIW